MKVRLSPAAKADLEAIADYIAADNPGRALSFVDEVQAHCDGIGDAPKAHAPRPDLGRGIRCRPHGRYLILYRITAGEVLVSRVVHASRDVRRLAQRGEVNELRPAYEVSDFEALGFLRVPERRAGRARSRMRVDQP